MPGRSSRDERDWTDVNEWDARREPDPQGRRHHGTGEAERLPEHSEQEVWDWPQWVPAHARQESVAENDDGSTLSPRTERQRVGLRDAAGNLPLYHYWEFEEKPGEWRAMGKQYSLKHERNLTAGNTSFQYETYSPSSLRPYVQPNGCLVHSL